jgi:hypothetical protein
VSRMPVKHTPTLMAWRMYLIPFGPLLVSTSSLVLLRGLIIRRKIRVEQVIFGWVLHIIFAAVEGAVIAWFGYGL